MELRPYQSEALQAVYDHLRTRDDNPCVVIPTGGGKTPLIAAICRDTAAVWNGRILILAHVKELLEQAASKVRLMAPDLEVGIYSAGMRRRELTAPVTIAGIQSIWKRAGDLGPVDLIIIDEAHMVPRDEDGMYREFLADARLVNPAVRVIGLTATPFRLDSGPICGPPEEAVLHHICYEAGVRELMVQGYLCPLRTKAGTCVPDTSGLHLRGGEFIGAETEALMDQENLVEAACAEMVQLTADRKSVLIFSTGVQHGKHVVEHLKSRHGLECGLITAQTSKGERARLIDRLLAGNLKYLCNINVLTTGFDAPNIDAIVLLRPTGSSGLYYQMVGRGFRIHPGKADCLVLDYGGNVLRHGPVDALRINEESRGNGDNEAPAKQCPQCAALIAAGYSICPECGHEFPEPVRQSHEARATTASILSRPEEPTELTVTHVSYHIHTKRDDPDAPPTMRVEYHIGLLQTYREWICFEHTGFARAKAEKWWRDRSNDPVPSMVWQAVALADDGAVAPTLSICFAPRTDRMPPAITRYRIGPKPKAQSELTDEEVRRIMMRGTAQASLEVAV